MRLLCLLEGRGEILPAVQRLEAELSFAGDTPARIRTVLRTGESEAAALFRGETQTVS